MMLIKYPNSKRYNRNQQRRNIKYIVYHSREGLLNKLNKNQKIHKNLSILYLKPKLNNMMFILKMS